VSLFRAKRIAVIAGICLVAVPMALAFLSGLLFAHGRAATFGARLSYHFVDLAATPSMITGSLILIWSLSKWRVPHDQS